MKNVKVLLREKVEHLGGIGDIVAVAPGYARNYLLPRRLATEATEDNVKAMQRRRERYEADLVAREAEINERIEALGRLTLRTAQKADENGHLYGSVNASVVATLLVQAGFEAQERDVRLEEPIKTIGSHEVPIHIRDEHYGGVQLIVESAD